MMRTSTVVLILVLASLSAAQAQPRPLLGDDLGILGITLGESVVYELEVGDAARTLTYSVPRRGVAQLRITNTAGRELLAIRSQGRNATYRVNRRPVTLRDDQSLYDVEGVDLRAVWLAQQDYIASACIGVDWLEEAADQITDGTPDRGLTTLLNDLARTWQSPISQEAGTGKSTCSSSSEASCTEIDIDGNSSVVTYTCNCGTAVCRPETFTVTIRTLIVSTSGEPEEREEQKSYTRCMCGCLNFLPTRLNTGGY